MPTGIKIKEIRKQQGLTQKELGNLCGIADSNIRKYENGKQNPKLETLKKIADALNVSVAELDPSLNREFGKHVLEFHSSNSVLSILEHAGYKIIQTPCMFNSGDWEVKTCCDHAPGLPSTCAFNEKLSYVIRGCKDYKGISHCCESCNRMNLTQFILRREKRTITLTVEEMQELCYYICEYIDFMFWKQSR